MKKIIFLTFLFLTACTKTITVNNYNNIEKNTVYFIKKDNSTSLLIYNNNKTTLIQLENKEKIYTNNNLKINNLILLNNIITNIDYDNKYILKKNMNINNIDIIKTDKLIININNYNLCIYDKNININGDYTKCDFIYILNNESEINIKLSNKTKAIFYNEYKTFQSSFLEKIYISWIDTYAISTNNITKLTLEDNYNIENVSNTIFRLK